MRTTTALTVTPDELEDMAFTSGVPIEMTERYGYLTLAGTTYRAEIVRDEGVAA